MRWNCGVLIMVLCVPSLTFGDDETKARFQAEYPDAAKKLEKRFSQVKGSCSLTDSKGQATNPERRQTATFAIDHGYEKVTISRLFPGNRTTPQKSEIVYCVGQDTLFYLTRLPGAKDFAVEGINANGTDKSAYNMLFGRFSKANFAIFGVPVTKLMARGGYRLLDAEKIEPNGRSLVKVTFEIDGQNAKHDVVAVFDPALGWPLISSEYRIAGKSKLRIASEVEYGEPREGIALPRRVTFHDSGNETASCEFGGWEFEPTPIGEFGMGFYGLPDLVSSAAKPKNNLPYWLIAATLSSVALGITLWRLARRDASPLSA